MAGILNIEMENTPESIEVQRKGVALANLKLGFLHNVLHKEGLRMALKTFETTLIACGYLNPEDFYIRDKGGESEDVTSKIQYGFRVGELTDDEIERLR
jgi:hypothetical protein